MKITIRQIELDGMGLQIFAGDTNPPAGTATVWAMEKSCAYLSGVYVHPPFRRQGIARGMVKVAIVAAAEAGKDALQLWVHKTNDAAMNLYKSEGFLVAADADEKGNVMMIHPLKQQRRA